MNIEDNLILTAFSSVTLTFTAVIRILWNRSEECRKEHSIKDMRLDRSEQRIDKLTMTLLGCPVPNCPQRQTEMKTNWIQ